jgi:hypothetical protein
LEGDLYESEKLKIVHAAAAAAAAAVAAVAVTAEEEAIGVAVVVTVEEVAATTEVVATMIEVDDASGMIVVVVTENATAVSDSSKTASGARALTYPVYPAPIADSIATALSLIPRFDKHVP